MTDTKINGFRLEELNLIRKTLAERFNKIFNTDSVVIELEKILSKQLINKSNACGYAGIIF